jgi:hypothetical protein
VLCRTLYWKSIRDAESDKEVKCKTCDTLFTPKGNRKVFCSPECAKAWNLSDEIKSNYRNTPYKRRFEIFKRDKFRCRYCGRGIKNDPSVMLVLDHIVPISEGGTATILNLVTACNDCNIGKGAERLDWKVVKQLQEENKQLMEGIDLIKEGGI